MYTHWFIRESGGGIIYIIDEPSSKLKGTCIKCATLTSSVLFNPGQVAIWPNVHTWFLWQATVTRTPASYTTQHVSATL